jgi:hypothetical protein
MFYRTSFLEIDSIKESHWFFHGNYTKFSKKELAPSSPPRLGPKESRPIDHFPKSPLLVSQSPATSSSTREPSSWPRAALLLFIVLVVHLALGLSIEYSNEPPLAGLHDSMNRYLFYSYVLRLVFSAR